MLVEGAKDERALRAVGVSGRIERLHRGASVQGVCERLSREHPEVIVLTDWDTAGGKLARLAADALSSNGARAKLEFRRTFAIHTRREIHQVESLPVFLARLQEKAQEEQERAA